MFKKRIKHTCLVFIFAVNQITLLSVVCEQTVMTEHLQKFFYTLSGIIMLFSVPSCSSHSKCSALLNIIRRLTHAIHLLFFNCGLSEESCWRDAKKDGGRLMGNARKVLQ